MKKILTVILINILSISSAFCQPLPTEHGGGGGTWVGGSAPLDGGSMSIILILCVIYLAWKYFTPTILNYFRKA